MVISRLQVSKLCHRNITRLGNFVNFTKISTIGGIIPFLFRFATNCCRGQGASENVDLAKVVSLAVYRLYVALFFKNGIRSQFAFKIVENFNPFSQAMLKRILYAESGIGKTQEMLAVLKELPKISKTEITLLHALKPQITTEAEIVQEKEAKELLTKVINDLKLDEIKVSSLLVPGEPKDVVCEVAQSIDTDLIILGSRGLGRISAILLNSLSQYVFQLTDRSMLIVRNDVYVTKIKRVMVALNESPAARYALELSLDLLQGYPGCELILVRIDSGLKSNKPPLSRSQMENDSILAPALAQAKKMGIDNCRCLLTGGKPGRQICKLVEKLKIDLLAIGSPERRPEVAKTLPDFDRLFGSSLSDYLRLNADCPVLLARKEFV